MCRLAIAILPMVLISACSKSSTSSNNFTQPTDSCKTDICHLTSYTWRISKEIVMTDIGDYTYTTSQLSGISWATFVFHTDSTYMPYQGAVSNYTFNDSDKSLWLVYNNLPLHFKVSYISTNSLTFNTDKIYMNPRTDSSVAASFAIQEIAGGLKNDFGADTSKIHYFQAVYTYLQ